MFWLEAEVKGGSLGFFGLSWVRKGVYIILASRHTLHA